MLGRTLGRKTFGKLRELHARKGKILSSEELQLIVMKLLAEKPSHGYELIKAVAEHSSGVYAPSPGMIYPALTYLEEISYAAAKADGTKNRFHLTRAGQAFLEENAAQAAAIWEELGRYGQKMAWFEKQIADEESAGERWGGTPQEQEKKEWRKIKMEFHEVRHELKAALFEKFSAPLEEKKRVLSVLRAAIAEIRRR